MQDVNTYVTNHPSKKTRLESFFFLSLALHTALNSVPELLH